MTHKTMFQTAVCCAALLATSGIALAEDWPQWQGLNRDAKSAEKGLLKEWPADGPPLAWKITGLGGGDSTPSVAKGRIYGMSNRGEDEVVWALNESDGKQLWATKLGGTHQQRIPQSKEGPGCTPTVDGDRLYALGMGGELACLQTADGKLLWKRNLVTDLGGQIPPWSYRESPLIDGDKIICTPGATNALIVALDKMTGKTVWQTPGLPPAADPAPSQGRGRGGAGRSDASYASPVAFEFSGQRQYAQLTSRALVGVSATDGKLLWRYDAPANGNGINCTTPIYHDGHVFGTSAYGAGGGLAKLTKDDTGGFKAEEVWFAKKMQNHHGGVILHDGALYGANGGNEGGFLVCLDFQSGKVLWDGRDDTERRAPKGSIALADGRLYYRTEKGAVLLIEPSTKEYIERGRFEQPDRTKLPAWTHPVIANGKLYIRDHDTLFCYDVKAK